VFDEVALGVVPNDEVSVPIAKLINGLLAQRAGDFFFQQRDSKTIVCVCVCVCMCVCVCVCVCVLIVSERACPQSGRGWIGTPTSAVRLLPWLGGRAC